MGPTDAIPWSPSRRESSADPHPSRTTPSRRLVAAGTQGDDAIAQAAKLAGISTDNARAIQYERPETLFKALTDVDAKSVVAPQSNLETLLDLTTPRAYYLFSSLPSAAVLGPKAE